MTDVSTTTEPTKDGKTIELLSFLVSGQDYCVDIMSVREIRGSARATPLPHSPAYIRGVINLRGAVLPIMDLSARLDLQSATDTSRNVIIVVSTHDRTVGLMVDAVSDILALPESKLQSPPEMPSDEGRAFISALTIVDDRMIRVLDLSAILPTANEDAA
ncbi:chemotaxis protein CheW [Maritimibacter sp. HL-12]|jgi:purine-binding chemotaxis protein CheW|uniref:chemotaxis protein CheW n=1 Tax=Maritimibacter sp. HL-12 TaxID=1162418 RepID=UPI000A0F1B04|nr:chemotaxis protein CheW [Maritimibacter sp. HL-12]SMH56912.1 purine-binding chemotaxis protein CheW [Maritimibacter sp. HL-12]